MTYIAFVDEGSARPKLEVNAHIVEPSPGTREHLKAKCAAAGTPADPNTMYKIEPLGNRARQVRSTLKRLENGGQIMIIAQDGEPLTAN
jgi:hypothetical protein